MDTVLDVKETVRSLVGDVDGDFVTDAYIMPLMNQAYTLQLNKLQNACSPFVTQLVVVPDLPQGTATLQTYQTKGKPLYGLFNPLDMEIKPQGQPETAYRPTRRFDKLPNTSAASPAQPNLLYWGGIGWEYRAYVLFVTALPYPADIRVRGDFRPPKLVNDADILTLHPLMGASLSFATAALIGAERGNQGYIQNYGEQASETLDDILAELVRSQQGTTSRVARMSRSRRRGSGGSLGPQ